MEAPVNRCHPDDAQTMVGVSEKFLRSPNWTNQAWFWLFVTGIPEVEDTKKGCQPKKVSGVVKEGRGPELNQYRNQEDIWVWIFGGQGIFPCVQYRDWLRVLFVASGSNILN